MKTPFLIREDFSKLNGVEIFNADKLSVIRKISTDSRVISTGELFVAIKGDKFDGHEFIQDAVDKGASAVLVNMAMQLSFSNLNVPVITVPNTVLALGELAALWRKKLKTKIIAVTGSAGKTTVKEMIAAFLKVKYSVNKTIGNNNNHIGVPLTILSTSNKHDFLVLELGTNHFGEIDYTARIAQPDFALITNIGQSHLEFLKNPKGVFREKKVLFDITKLNSGKVFINNDDKFLSAAARNYKNKMTFAFTNKADIKGKIVKFSNAGQPVVSLNFNGRSKAYQLPFYGEQSAENFLAASAVAINIGLNSQAIKNGLKQVKAADKRLNVVSRKNFILINDTYNANPNSMLKALKLLAMIKIYPRHIAVLGDMFELGDSAVLSHKKLAERIIELGIDEIYTIGNLMQHLNAKLKQKIKQAVHFNSRESLANYLKGKSYSDAVILVKGSRGMKMEDFVEAILSKK